MPRRTATEEQIDQPLTEVVKAAFGTSPSIKFPDIQVEALAMKKKFLAAKGVPGVVRVETGAWRG